MTKNKNKKVIMIRFIQVIFSVKQKFNKQAKAAMTNTNLSNSRKMLGKTNNNIYKKMCKTTLIYIVLQAEDIYNGGRESHKNH